MKKHMKVLNHSVMYLLVLAFILLLPTLSCAYVESFENGIPGSWTTSGDGTWATTTDTPQDGTTSLQSPTIAHQQSATLESIRSVATGDLTFYYKTSTEENNDELQFYIDGELIDSFSGENDWTQASYPVTAGLHTFTWIYSKDLNFSEGEDRVWLDLVQFPGQKLAAGKSHSLYIHKNRTLWAWGRNSFGQLGDGTTTDRISPVQIGSDNDWGQIVAGEYHTVAIKTDGTLWGWGLNSYGQLGDGTTTRRYSPVQIGSDNDWGQIVAGEFHTVAIKTDGTLWAWGWNMSGQLGDGTTTDRISPVQIGSDNDWGQIVAGEYHTVAIKTDGTLWGWGLNSYGQLGDGTTTDRISPVPIGSDNDWGQIVAGEYHTVAIKSDGTLWAWGWNFSGQLGDGTTGNRYVPTQILTFIDTDNDGTPDITDAFPTDPAASVDSDGDGYPDSWNDGYTQSDSTTGLIIDTFPNNASEWLDSDGDGYGDNSDVFPNDITEWFDSDGDGVGDNTDPTVLSDNAEFIKQVYRDFLGREADSGGLAYWTDQLNGGHVSQAELVEQYLLSAEFGQTVAPVARLYFAYFNRIPDYNGLMYWIDSYAQGTPLVTISDAFAGSAEFTSTYGSLSNSDFVTLVYQNVLGRGPDAGGLSYWTGLLDSGAQTRGQVMVGFSESAEYQNLMANQIYVTMTYIGLLRRSPDQGGFDYWTSVLDSGASGTALINGFLFASEYQGRFDGTWVISSLAIDGSTSVNENSSASYTATATWENGATSLVAATWSENSGYASMSSGILTTTGVSSDTAITLTASYASGGVTEIDNLTVTITDIPNLYNQGTEHPGDWRISQIEYDNNNDGVIDDTDIHTYNSAGNYLREEDAKWNNEIRYYTYDEQGRKTTKTVDDDRDGSINVTEAYAYDLNGYMVERTLNNVTSGYAFQELYTYDAYGNIISKSSYRFDNGVLGELTAIVNYYYDLNNYTYDSNNKPIKIEDDYNAGGVIDSVFYLTYNSFGFIEKKEIDNDDDGVIDYTYNVEYDSAGNWTKFESVGNWSNQFSYDNSPETRINNAFSYDDWSIWEDTTIGPDYFESMRVWSKEETDQDGNGLIDEVNHISFDSNGLVDKIEYDTNNDGAIDAVEYYTWIR